MNTPKTIANEIARSIVNADDCKRIDALHWMAGNLSMLSKRRQNVSYKEIVDAFKRSFAQGKESKP
jgi:hypothetical protein